MANDLTQWLLIYMPFAFAFKTVATGIATIVLARQHNAGRLGVYIFWFFTSLVVSSFGLTWLFYRLATMFHDSANLAPWLPLLAITELGTTGVAVFGALMVRERRRT